MNLSCNMCDGEVKVNVLGSYSRDQIEILGIDADMLSKFVSLPTNHHFKHCIAWSSEMRYVERYLISHNMSCCSSGTEPCSDTRKY